MDQQISLPQGRGSPGQRTTAKEEPDAQMATTTHEIPTTISPYLTPKLSQSPPDSDSDDSPSDESEHSSQRAAPIYNLPENHRFQDIRSELMHSVLNSPGLWSKTTRYVSPPDDTPSHRKRFRASHRRGGGDTDDGFVVVDPPARNFHLACPFYTVNPANYQNCLLHDNLESNEDVIRHILRKHMKPPYCPICSLTFESLRSRDSHILERKCERCDLQHIDGINFYQASRLKRCYGVDLGEEECWRYIYAAVFPDSGDSPSPYLDKGCGKAVSMARDYWATEGRCTISKFLESHNMLGKDEDEKDAQEALSKLVLEDVLNDIVTRPQDS